MKALLFLLLPAGLLGAGYSAVDGLVPVSLQPGAPAGSYRLSDFESINIYNGQLGASIPILQVGGRGEAGYAITVQIHRPPWLLETNPTVGTNPTIVNYKTTAVARWWMALSLRVDYIPGLVTQRRFGEAVSACPGSGGSAFLTTWSHLVFVSPDGTETPLYSQSNPGPTSTGGCGSLVPVSRGRKFAARDGSGMVFVSSSDIQDALATQAEALGPASVYGGQSGTLYMKNGLRYEINDGEVSAIVDRNGNRVTIGAQTGNQRSITDALGRTITITYGNPQTGTCDSIVYTGTGGNPRTITVCRTPLGAPVLRPVTGAQTLTVRNQHDITKRLFPEFDPLAPQQYAHQFGLNVVSSINLPNSRGYSFRYNIYGELSRVVLPTGGAIEYDHQAGLPLGTGVYESGQVLAAADYAVTGLAVPLPPTWSPFVYRRLAERRTYRDGGSSAIGSAVESTTTYQSSEVVTSYGTQGIAVNFGGSFSTSATGLEVSTPITSEHRFFSFPFRAAGQSSGMPQGVNHSTGGPANSLNREAHPNQGAVFGTPLGPGHPYEGREYLTRNGNRRQMQRVYGQAGDGSAQVCQELTTHLDTSQSSGRLLLYDRTYGAGFPMLPAPAHFVNQTDVVEYDYGAAPAVAPGQENVLGVTYDWQVCPASVPAGWLRRSHTEIKTDAAYVEVNEIGAYSPSLRSLPASQTTYGPGDVELARTSYSYDIHAAGGNPFAFTPRAGTVQNSLSTSETRRGNVTASSQLNKNLETGALAPDIVTYHGFDSLGNREKVRDPRGKDTTFTYQAPHYGFIQRVDLPKGQDSDPAGTNQFRQLSYDFSTGKPTAVSDHNGQAIALEYNDALDRLTKITKGGLQITNIVYQDDVNSPKTKVTADQFALNDQRLYQETQYDSFGRTARAINGPVLDRIWQETEYDGLGRVRRTGTPHRVANTVYWTTRNYDDPLGRLTLTQFPGDGSSASIAYVGNQTTSTNPAALVRVNTEDALGRLKRVVESPNDLGYVTDYFYNALDNVLTVSQQGNPNTSGQVAQTRTFAYDSLGRLIKANNPETGLVQYAYDANGNLSSRRDARNRLTCHGSHLGQSCGSDGI